MSRASTLAKAVGSNGDIAVSGSTTLGDAAGDNITINASTASIPNGLNFDSNTLVIDSTNNRVGIGTASPTVNFDIAGSGVATTQMIWSRGNADAAFVSSLRTGDAGSAAYQSTIGVDYAGYTDFSRIKFYRASTLGEIHFFTGGLSSNGSEKMRLDSNGNFMVGYTSTSAIANRNIDVNGTGDASFNVRVGGTTCAYLYSTAGQTILGTNINIPLTFYPNNIKRMS